MTLQQVRAAGGVVRAREGFGFYAVVQGKARPISQTEAEKALKQGQLTPEGSGPDKFGVLHFAIKK